ncbi:MAG: cellulose biosynthesis cyclic di-GMP-binding regulatory protein BcsB [Leptolyngbyaceae cyanobacterium CRU_2_3]|nr:cellulose biosynthesis cyclic di-GMP-binding regulatory protein BcsB [Leptolyngbyaceae cyanobacterium CRU_2_3]
MWKFENSPLVGNRLRLEGVYPEAQIGFTKPRHWEVKSAKVIVRFRQSPALLSKRSHLMLRVNDTSIGSKPLNHTNSEIGQAEFNIPAKLLYDENALTIMAEQQTAEDCTNPNNPSLWTEILPDSRLVFDYTPRTVQMNFSRYPYPIVDDLSLDANQIAYLHPKTISSNWLTATSRFQAEMGRLMDYRSFKTRTVDKLEDLKSTERLIIIGTPADQPILSKLALPYSLKNGRILDGKQQPLPNDVGVLMLTTSEDKETPILIATGNAPEGVNKAVQFLVQPQDRQLGTGQALTVNSLEELPSPAPRDWAGYLPTENKFNLSALTTLDRQRFDDTTVRGSNAPAVQIPFHALPDDRILRGSTLTLHYSYSPQLNPKTSAVEITLDGIALGAKQLNGNGGDGTLTVNLPDNLVKPTSMLNVHFMLQPREGGVCGLQADRQLWGTVHSDSSFNLVHNTVAHLPDLKLLTAGYPLAAPQDLSTTAIMLPDQPTKAELQTFLNFSERLGRMSRADSVKLQAYVARDLTETVKNEQHIVAIGTRDRLPLSEVMATKGFDLGAAFLRQLGGNSVQALPDQEGVVKSVISPWNQDRLLIGLTAQTEQGLKEVQDLLKFDQLFGQLQGDTTVISRNTANPSPYDPNGYSLQFFQQAPSQRTITQSNVLNRIVMFFQDNWWLIPIATILIGLLLYGFSQIYLNRVAESGEMR